MTTPRRLPTAHARLCDLLLARCTTPFVWGVSDCAMLAFDARRAITGNDPAHDLRGRYTTARDALRLLQRLGGLRGVLASRFGPHIALAAAQDGDAVLLRPGVCTGVGATEGALAIWWRGQLVGQGDAGLVRLPVSDAMGVWGAA